MYATGNHVGAQTFAACTPVSSPIAYNPLGSVESQGRKSRRNESHTKTAAKGTEKTVTTVYTVTGTKLHFEFTYVGPDPDKPRNKSQKLDAVIENDLVVDRALPALDKIVVTPTKPAADPAVDDQTGCVTRGKKTRCETARGDDAPTPGYKALTDLTVVLTENVPSPR
jgi:hypothetical protein